MRRYSVGVLVVVIGLMAAHGDGQTVRPPRPPVPTPTGPSGPLRIPTLEMPSGPGGTIRLTPDSPPPSAPPGGPGPSTSSGAFSGADPDRLIWNGCPPNCPDVYSYPNDPIARAIRDSAGVFTLDSLRDDLPLIYRAQRRAQAALKILTADLVVVLQPATGEYQRAALLRSARAELTTLMLTTLHDVVAHMKSDVATLTPYWWNPFRTKAREELARVSMEIESTSQRAEAVINSGSNVRELRSGSRESALHVRAGDAMRQLQQIDSTKIWKNQ
ncbi:MAG: hypothetical protein AB7P34_09240 [Vicinamibacterales bacterium]